MTEKSIKSLKNKKQHLNLKKPANQKQPKVYDSDSDISEHDDGKPRPKMDPQALNKISSEVTDLLASLKKEHGIENDDAPAEAAKSSPSKKDKKKLLEQAKKNNKNKPQQQQQPQQQKQQQQQKKRAANAENGLVSEIKKLKVDNTVENKTAKKQQQQQAKPKKGNANQKAKPVNQAAPASAMELDDSIDNANEAHENPSKKKNKKNKNKKRPAESVAVAATAADDESDDDDMDASAPQAKKAKTAPKQNQNQKQKQKPNAVEKAEKKQALNGDDAEEEDSQEEEASVKKEHHLKNAVPIYVGNLPNNIKRLKLVKLFKQFGKVLAIRFRSNSGKSLFKTSLIKKAPFVIAFIYFETREAAEASLMLNGTQIGENVIVVDLDANKKEKFNQPQPNTVVVGNLKYAVTEQILRKAFKCCGEIGHIRTIQGPEGCKGVAFIQFSKPESCELALKLHGTEILGREIRVERHSTKKKNKDKAQTKIQKGKKPNAGKGKTNAPKGGNDGASGAPNLTGKKKKNKAKPVKEFMGTKSADNKKISKKKKNKLSAERRLAKKVAPKSGKPASA